jgi:hypothetical protein
LLTALAAGLFAAALVATLLAAALVAALLAAATLTAARLTASLILISICHIPLLVSCRVKNFLSRPDIANIVPLEAILARRENSQHGRN